MSRPIRISQEYIEGLVAEFRESVQKAKFVDGKFSYTRLFEYSTPRFAAIDFSAEAFLKMIQLVFGFDSEVGWYGTVTRQGNNFRVEDIVVYPQTVTGATVNTDQKEHDEWVAGLDDEVFNHLRLHGHSHVSMSPNPSGVDINHQEKKLEEFQSEDDFFIFIIWNKKMNYTAKIYDMSTNTLYENGDIEMFVEDVPLEDLEFMQDAKAKAKSKSAAAKSAVKSSEKSSKKDNKSESSYKGYDDYYGGYEGFYGRYGDW